MASARCSGRMSVLFSRSAMVRETFRIRSYARAERFRAVHGMSQEFQTGGVGLCVTMQQAWRHLGITVDAGLSGKALSLYLSCLDDTFTDACTAFSRGTFGYLLKRYGNNLHLNVDTVEQRAGNLVQVTLYLSRMTDTMAGGMVVVAARTRVHRCNQLEVGWILQGIFGP